MKNKNLKPIVIMIVAIALVGVSGLMAQTKGTASSSGEGKEEETVLKGKTVNINEVTAEDLVKNVPLIAPELAKKIVKYREDNGDFMTLEELLEVDGFSRKLLRRIEKFLLLEGIGGDECTC